MKLWLLLVSSLASAAPYIAYRGVVNAASYAPGGLPNGPIARGSVFTIFGKELGPTAAQQVSSFPLATTFAGVSISVTQNTTTVAAIPLYVSATQINAIMPSSAPLGRVTLRVTYNNQTSNSAYLETTGVSLGLYSIYAGAGPGIFQNFIGPAEQPINSLISTARHGQVVTLWGTGLGAVASDTTAPAAGDLPTPVEVFVGSQPARKLYSGRSPCCAGSDQIVFEIPQDAPQGCYVPVTVRAGGKSSNTVTIAIESQNNACQDPANPLGSPTIEKRNTGIIITNMIRGPERIHANAFAHFEEQSGPFRFHPLQALPPVGSCAVYAGKANLGLRDFLPSFPLSGPVLAAAASLAFGAIQLVKPAVADPFYFWQFTFPTNGVTHTVRPGTETLQAPAGQTVGPLQASVPRIDFPGATFPALNTIRRADSLELRWAATASSSDLVVVAGSALNRPTNSAAHFLCLAAANSGRFTIPSFVLSSLPAAKNDAQGAAALAIGRIGAPADLAATGLLKSLALYTAFDYKLVEVQ